MERVDKLVNDILKKWNPLEVPSEIAEDEYSSYVTFIMKYSQNINSIYLCLKKILTDIMANVSGGWNYRAPGGRGVVTGPTIIGFITGVWGRYNRKFRIK